MDGRIFVPSSAKLFTAAGLLMLQVAVARRAL
jgi:hypothetical protein